MGIPEILMIIFLAMGLGCTLVEHGKRKEGYNNFWVSLTSVVIYVILLWSGGFFD